MIYLFKRGPTAHTLIYVTEAKSAQELKNEKLHSFERILFIYDDIENCIEVVNEHYDLIECTYFIYKHLGIFKQTNEVQIKYASTHKNCIQK